MEAACGQVGVVPLEFASSMLWLASAMLWLASLLVLAVFVALGAAFYCWRRAATREPAPVAEEVPKVEASALVGSCEGELSGWYSGTGGAVGLKIRVEMNFSSNLVYIWSSSPSVFAHRQIKGVDVSVAKNGELEFSQELMDGLAGTVVEGITGNYNGRNNVISIEVTIVLSRFTPSLCVRANLKSVHSPFLGFSRQHLSKAPASERQSAPLSLPPPPPSRSEKPRNQLSALNSNVEDHRREHRTFFEWTTATAQGLKGGVKRFVKGDPRSRGLDLEALEARISEIAPSVTLEERSKLVHFVSTLSVGVTSDALVDSDHGHGEAAGVPIPSETGKQHLGEQLKHHSSA